MNEYIDLFREMNRPKKGMICINPEKLLPMYEREKDTMQVVLDEPHKAIYEYQVAMSKNQFVVDSNNTMLERAKAINDAITKGELQKEATSGVKFTRQQKRAAERVQEKLSR
jgi:hypothetical protein